MKQKKLVLIIWGFVILAGIALPRLRGAIVKAQAADLIGDMNVIKVAVIADGQRLNTAAANAFLKTLEEPPPATVIFLLTTGTEGMLPTILSRCQRIRFEPWPEAELARLLQEIGAVAEDVASAAARTAQGNARRGLALLGNEARLMTTWATLLFEGIHRQDRALAAIAADWPCYLGPNPPWRGWKVTRIYPSAWARDEDLKRLQRTCLSQLWAYRIRET